jgi:hypothetical protein
MREFMRPIRRSAQSILARFCRCSCVSALAIAPALAQSPSEAIREGRSSLGAANRAAWLDRVEQSRARYEAFAARARLAIHPAIIEPGVAPTRTGILDDPTLRRGDVIVTSEGLMVFRGGRRFPYTPADFDPVISPAAAGVRHAPELIELQRAHEQGKR